MEHFEMAELLSKKAGVSLEDARQALEENQWDMLDAMIALERKNKAEGKTVYVETEKNAGADSGESGYSEPQQTHRVKNMGGDENMGFKAGCSQIWHYIKRAFQITVENDFVIIRRDKRLLNMPVLALIVLLICCFWVTLPLLVIGLFCGCQYRFEGKQVPAAVNKAMEKIDDVTDQIKEKLDGSDDGNQQ